MSNNLGRSGAALLSLALAATPALSSDHDLMRMVAPEEFTQAQAVPVPAGKVESVTRRGKLPAAAFSAGAGAFLTQTGSVRTSCFPTRLNAVLRDISAHFGRPVVVTSGYRLGGRSGSLHRKCQAADIQIAGVTPSAIARYARSLEAVGGVGTYGHTRSVHVDIGDRVFSWFGNRRRNAMMGPAGCCPACAVMASNSGTSRFEAVCTS